MSVGLAVGWPLLAKWTMTHVGLFYAVYLLSFGAFIGVIALLKGVARRAMLNNNTDAALLWYDRLWFLFGPAVRKEIKPQIQINLALVHASQGNDIRALRLLTDARRAARNLKTPELLIHSCVLIARMQQKEKLWDQAAWTLTEARKASEADRKTPGLMRIIQLQAEMALQRDQLEVALGCFQHLRRLADARRDPSAAVLALTQIGRLTYEGGDWDGAEQYLSDAVSRVREHHLIDRGAILACLLFGRLSLQRGQYELARGYLQDAATRAKQREEPALECSALIEAARLWVERGRFVEAEKTGDQALKIANTLNDPARQAMASQVMGDMHVQMEQWQSATVHLDHATAILEKSALPRTSLLVQGGQALILAHSGDPETALNELLALEKEAESLNAGYERVVILDALARVALVTGDGLSSQGYQSGAHLLRQQLGIEAAISQQYRTTLRVEDITPQVKSKRRTPRSA